MKIRLKKRGTFGVKKIELGGRIGKIVKNPEFGKEGLVVFFRGLEGIGTIGFGKKEMEMLLEKLSVKKEEKISSVKKKVIVKKKAVRKKGKRK